MESKMAGKEEIERGSHPAAKRILDLELDKEI